MAFSHKGKKYSSKKHPVLEYIFQKYFEPAKPADSIIFYLSDISEGYRKCGISEPVSISNTILDLCRQNRGVASRLPASIYELGYDLRKKTGSDKTGRKYAGEFVQVGVGNEINSWLVWREPDELITISSNNIPELVKKMIRADEGALFSIIDYCDVFTQVLTKGERSIYRIQNPMKWQPNEIDGFYGSEDNGKSYIYPVEAKALTTGDEINMDQLTGGFNTVIEKMKNVDYKVEVQQIAVRMIKNGIDIAIFSENLAPTQPEKVVRVQFNPKIDNWN